MKYEEMGEYYQELNHDPIYDLFSKMIDSGVLEPEIISQFICDSDDKSKSALDLTVEDFIHLSDNQILDVLRNWVAIPEIDLFKNDIFSLYDNPKFEDPNYEEKCFKFTPFAEIVKVIQQVPNRYSEKFENKIVSLGQGLARRDALEFPDYDIDDVYKYDSSKQILKQYSDERYNQLQN